MAYILMLTNLNHLHHAQVAQEYGNQLLKNLKNLIMNPEIVSLKKEFWGEQKVIEIIWKYKELRMTNFIIGYEFDSEKEIYEYLNKLIKLNPLKYEN